MRKILLGLSALIIVGQTHSQNNDNTIVVIRVIEDIVPETRTNRSVALSPVECRYYVFTGMLELTFRSNLGAVYVTLDNLSTGETCDYSGNSVSGLAIPVSSDSCYTMTITTESGRVFHASFLTGNADGED